MRIIFLATDAHGGFGGISQYNRDVLEVMSRWAEVESVDVIVRSISQEFEAPPKIHYQRASSKSLALFFIHIVKYLFPPFKFDLIYCAHLNLLPFARLLSFVSRKPILLVLYGIEAWVPPPRFLQRALAQKLDLAIMSISRVTADRFLAWSGASENMLSIVPNAFHSESFGMGPPCKILLRKYGLGERKIILTLGRMPDKERQKGFDEVLEALPDMHRLFPNLLYLAVGDGPDRERLERKAENLGISDSVVFTGRVTESDKRQYYRLADAYIMPSSGEGFGFVILEALASGLPVVASRIDGTREAVLDGELGDIVDPSDRQEIVSAISGALTRGKKIPEGLDFFSFENFSKRLKSATLNAVRTGTRQ